MEKDSDNILEQAKQLALTIALFNKKYDALLEDFNKKISKVSAQLKSDRENSSEAISFIKENVAYQANLESTKEELELVLKSINENFDNYSLVHEHPYALDNHNHSQYSTTDHVHDYVENSVYSEESRNHTEKLYELNTYTNEMFKAITSSIEEKYAFLILSLESTNKELDEVSESLATGIDNVEHKLDNFKSSTRKDIKDLVEIIDVVKKSFAKQLDKMFSKVSKEIEDTSSGIYKTIDRVQDKINSDLDNLEDELSERIDTKSDDGHDHDELYMPLNKNFDDAYSNINHTHDDILTSVDVLQEKTDTLEVSINKVFEELENKPEYSEILLKSDLVRLKHEIVEAIPIPKDGKDAEEWEFKPHPSQPGILIFKKESDKNWNYINFNMLIPKAKDFQEQPKGISGFVGGGGSGSSISILWNNTIAATSPSVINFTGSGISAITQEDNTVTVEINGGGIADTGTGWAVYRDNNYISTSPLIISGGVVTHLPNNAGVSFETELPAGVDKFYDGVTGKLLPVSVGDYYIFTIRFKSNCSVNGTYLDFGVNTQGPLGYIFRQSVAYIKGAGVENAFTITCPGFVSANFFNNGGKIMITPINGSVEIYDIEYQIARVHKA
jgi:hypothetical protein